MQNKYLDNLSINDELPRLAAQARLLSLVVNHFFTEFKLNNSSFFSQILDVGSGTGTITSLLNKNYPGTSITGMDISDAMVRYAQLSYPKIQWVNGDIHKIPFPDSQFSMVFSSYVLIHLSDLSLALRELVRVLDANGIVIIVNPNDDRFYGNEKIKSLVKEHARIYTGDRYVMNHLKEAAIKEGLEQIYTKRYRLENSAKEEKPEFDGETLKVGKMTAWAMIAYMGQIPELAEIYSECQSQYMSEDVQFGAELEIHVYKK